MGEDNRGNDYNWGSMGGWRANVALWCVERSLLTWKGVNGWLLF